MVQDHRPRRHLHRKTDQKGLEKLSLSRQAEQDASRIENGAHGQKGKLEPGLGQKIGSEDQKDQTGNAEGRGKIIGPAEGLRQKRQRSHKNRPRYRRPEAHHFSIENQNPGGQKPRSPETGPALTEALPDPQADHGNMKAADGKKMGNPVPSVKLIDRIRQPGFIA